MDYGLAREVGAIDACSGSLPTLYVRSSAVPPIRLKAFCLDMNANADAFRDTVRDIITILQAYETRRGKITRPPMSIQFYEYMVSETQDYGRRGRNLGINLAQEFSRKLDPNTQSQCTINIGQVNNIPCMVWSSLLNQQ
jgi:hypothetical protein